MFACVCLSVCLFVCHGRCPLYLTSIHSHEVMCAAQARESSIVLCDNSGLSFRIDLIPLDKSMRIKYRMRCILCRHRVSRSANASPRGDKTDNVIAQHHPFYRIGSNGTHNDCHAVHLHPSEDFVCVDATAGVFNGVVSRAIVFTKSIFWKDIAVGDVCRLEDRGIVGGLACSRYFNRRQRGCSCGDCCVCILASSTSARQSLACLGGYR
jgi:hypothetical protein